MSLDDIADAPASGVRFAAARAELGEASLVVVSEAGERRELAWADLAAALARDLTGAPFAPGTTMVDLLPRQGAPVRLLTSTRLQIPGTAPPGTPLDDLRRALALCRAMQPDLQLEDATADFVYRREALPPWTAADLASYDRRYGAG
ncbi:MAG: hypothetical protein H6708_30345 [Kofleriaceae bacterium]|nr:hypothetical protein [Kofleriaceae bacterium]